MQGNFLFHTKLIHIPMYAGGFKQVQYKEYICWKQVKIYISDQTSLRICNSVVPIPLCFVVESTIAYILLRYGVRATTEQCSVAIIIMSIQCIVGVVIQVSSINFLFNIYIWYVYHVSLKPFCICMNSVPYTVQYIVEIVIVSLQISINL